MSGGVDSSVAAVLLKQQGYDLIGITLQIWPDVSPSETKNISGCCSLSAVEDARRVANTLDIPHYVLNFQEIFQSKVIDNFVAEYKDGRTPNPCIRCNEHIKFKALLDKADELGADFIATGHYARIKSKIQNPKSKENPKSQIQNQYSLLKGKDATKDQSYVLYMLNQENLPRILFPLGDLTKVEVRRMAADMGLKVADKPDSQEICFVPDNDYARFLEKFIPKAVKPGRIVDKRGKVYGGHRGIINYTIGQRRGLGVSYKKPLYVTGIDKEKNEVIVGEEDDTYGDELIARDVSFVGEIPARRAESCEAGGQNPTLRLCSGLVVSKVELPKSKIQTMNTISYKNGLFKRTSLSAKIRYKTPEYKAELIPLDGDRVKVQFEEPVKAITPGQAVVFYDGDEVLGGGTIC